MNREVKKIFEETFKGKNIMTPDILDYKKVGGYLVELSTGRGFGSGAIFGVTVLEESEEEEGKYKRSSLSQCLHDREEAIDYILSLADFKDIEEDEEE